MKSHRGHRMRNLRRRYGRAAGPSVGVYETRAVLVGAYPTSNKASFLTHGVETDVQGVERRVLCGRVSLENIADTHASDVALRPTCPVCLRKDPRFRKGL